jgi:hypothetical protein
MQPQLYVSPLRLWALELTCPKRRSTQPIAYVGSSSKDPNQGFVRPTFEITVWEVVVNLMQPPNIRPVLPE